MSTNESPTDFIWGLVPIGEEAGCIRKDGTVNIRVTQDRVKRGIIPAWKRDGIWQSARSVIRQKLTSGDNT
jgi:hypothetical protein